MRSRLTDSLHHMVIWSRATALQMWGALDGWRATGVVSGGRAGRAVPAVARSGEVGLRGERRPRRLGVALRGRSATVARDPRDSCATRTLFPFPSSLSPISIISSPRAYWKLCRAKAVNSPARHDTRTGSFKRLWSTNNYCLVRTWPAFRTIVEIFIPNWKMRSVKF